MAAPQQVPDSRRLFVGNLSPKVEENDVRLFFQDVGDIDSIDFPGIGVGYCHINFATKRGARRAMRRKNNRRLEGQRVWCNLKLKPKKDKFEGHIILEQDIMVLNDINDISRVRGVLEAKYGTCGGADGRVLDVLLPKHHIKKNKGRAFVRFNTELAVEDALTLNNRQRSVPNIRVPTYTARPAENIHSGGSGGIYGFETEEGGYIFKDHKHYKAPTKTTFT